MMQNGIGAVFRQILSKILTVEGLGSETLNRSHEEIEQAQRFPIESLRALRKG